MKIESLRSAAVRYASRGWRVFPVQARGKLPLVSKQDGGNGCLDGTSDAATVDAWWEATPSANIGLHCGPGSGVWVLDVDTEPPAPRPNREEERIAGIDALNLLEVEHGALPATLRAQTGRGGLHLYFRVPHDRKIRNRVAVTLPNGARASIDVRTEGGYVVVPPSVHSNGSPYRWIDERDPVDAPDWLLDLVAPVEAPRREWTRPAPVAEGSPKQRYAAKVLDSACADVAQAQGARHDTLNVRAFTLGGYVAAGYLDRGVVERALYDAALVSMGEGRDREIRRTIADGLNKGGERPIEIPDRPGAVVPDPPEWLLDDDVPLPDDDDAPGTRVVVLPPPERPRPTVERPWAVAGSAALAVEPEADAGMPKINFTQRQASDYIDASWRALLRANSAGQPTLFATGGRLARLRRSEQGAAIDLCEPVHVQSMLIRCARWMKSKKAPQGMSTEDGFVEVDAEAPPQIIAEDMVAAPREELPVLEQVVYGPTFAADGTLLGEAGYHAAAHRWYEETRPIEPVRLTLDEARDVLLDWLADFPFATDADRAHAVGLFLLPFVRDLVRGMTPVHVIEAPTPGTGKTLLARVLLSASMGREPAIHSFPKDEAEVHKTLSSALLAGRQVMVFDNVKGRMDSPAFEGATTTPRFAARILGITGEMDVPVRCIWVLTANNVQMSPDLVRRSVRIRIVRLSDAPFDPSQARHPDIVGWTLDNHSLLTSAALRLVWSWLEAGRPECRETLGTYEEWARIIGGILDNAGIPGFLTGREEFKASADPIGEEWREFVAAWASRYGGRLASAKELLELAEERGVLGRLVERCSGEHSRITTFGDRLREKVDNVIAGHRISRKKSGSWGYLLSRVGPGEPDTAVGALFPSEVPV